MLQRAFLLGFLGLAPALGTGCPCCSLVAGETKPEKGDPLGAETRVPTADEVKTYQLASLVRKVQGQYVSAVDKGGPADIAGLRVGDVLLALDANKVYSRDDIEDFLRVSQPGANFKILVKRAGTFKEETVTVTLGVKAGAADGKHFIWQYAGLGQLDAALAAAKKDSKVVLVGLSGADT